MPIAYFVIPGLLLPANAEVSDEALALAGRFSATVKGDIVRQTFVAGPQAGSTHLAWVWRVVTRRSLPFSSAPFAWLIDDGPDLTSEIWSLTFFSDTDGINDVLLTDDTVEALCAAMRRPLQDRGFTLQRWDRTFYLTRKSGWGVITPEWPVIGAGLATSDAVAPLPEACDEIARDASEDLRALRETLIAAGITDERGRPITNLAITSGGCQQRFNPPTKFRSVLADTPFIRCWAQESGILNHRTGRVSGAKAWPADAPAGDVIAVLEGLYDAWLARDWKAWEANLPGVVSTFETLAEAAKKKNCSTAVVVACGMTDTQTVTNSISTAGAAGLLARLRQKSVPAQRWIFE